MATLAKNSTGAPHARSGPDSTYACVQSPWLPDAELYQIPQLES